MKNVADLIARIVIGLFFLYEAFDTMVFFKQTKETLSSYGFEFAQDVFITISIIFLLIGGIMVIIGYYASVGAFLLFVYWFVFTMIVYSFWNDPEDIRRLHTVFFMRNMALCGGLLLLVANGAGDYSVRRIFHVMRLPK